MYCEKEYEKEINKELIERFANTYKFCDNDLDKFIMLLRKGVYPYEYIDENIELYRSIVPSRNSYNTRSYMGLEIPLRKGMGLYGAIYLELI